MPALRIKNKKFKGIIESLRRGEVIVCPTDTVYGLICDAENKKAVAKIFKIKRRLKDKPLSVFVKDLKMAKEVAKINKSQEQFLKKVWPGQTIAILKANSSAWLRVKGIISKSGKIGLRIPDYKLLDILLEKFNSPLAQTSANISGELPVREIKEVLKQFTLRPFNTTQGKRGAGQEKYLPDLILDGGKLKSKKPSRVIDLTSKKPKILR